MGQRRLTRSRRSTPSAPAARTIDRPSSGSTAARGSASRAAGPPPRTGSCRSPGSRRTRMPRSPTCCRARWRFGGRCNVERKGRLLLELCVDRNGERRAHYNSGITMPGWSRGARLAWLLVVCASAAGAQTLPSEPIALAGGRVTIGGDISASYGSDDTGFFNYTDYEHSALRLLRIDLSAAAKLSPHFTLLGEVRTENLGRVRPYAFYLRIKPWTARDFDIQVGRVPPTFGAFTRRTYANDNPLVGYPLGYQYLTTL